MTFSVDSVDNVDTHKTDNLMELSLPELHGRLSNSNQGDPEAIKAAIRAQLPTVKTTGLLPHKKTPRGSTKVLHMNYMHSQTDASGQTEIEHLQFFARTVKELGLRLEILTDNSCREEIDQELYQPPYQGLNFGVTISQEPVSKWAEDSVEYLQNGQMAVLSLFDQELLDEAMQAGRRDRWQGKVPPERLEDMLQNDQRWILLGTRVNALQTSLERERVAQIHGQQVARIRAYIEGGNMITGEDAKGNPLILVGKDAIAATAHIYQLSYDDIRHVICEDFGLDTLEQVVCVEQPGNFHLDMGLLFLGNGIIVLNDSSAALKDAIEIAELTPCTTTEQKAAKLKLRHSLEEDASKDLQLAGLKVIRKTLENDVFYNFFNGEFVEGDDSLTYYITNGGLKE
ncbi:MAG: hypothetical protein AAGB19_08830, partial [Cyanobacteria bacterium P01_F01_bin.3]